MCSSRRPCLPSGLAWTDYRFLTSGPERERVTGRSDVVDALSEGVGRFIGSILGVDMFDPVNDIVPTINGWFREGHLILADAIHRTIIDEIIEGTPDGSEALPSDLALAGRDFTFEDWDEKVASLGDLRDGVPREISAQHLVSTNSGIAASRVTRFVDCLPTFADVARRGHRGHQPAGRSNAIRAVVFNGTSVSRRKRERRWTCRSGRLLPTWTYLRTRPHGRGVALCGTGALGRDLRSHPHWGQKHEAHAYPSLYPLLSRWQGSMTRLARAQGGTRQTLGSAFARYRGLYPRP